MSRSGILKYVIPLLLGPMIGAVLIFVLNLEGEWRILGLGCILIPLIMLSVRNPKRLFLAALLLFILFSTNYTFMRTPYLASGAQGFSVALSDFALVALLVFWLLEVFIKRRSVRFFPNMLIPIVCLITFSVISIYKSVDMQLSVFELFRLVKLLILFIVVANNVENQEDIRLIVMVLLVGLFMESVIASLQMLKGGPLGLSIIGEYDELTEITLGSATTYRVGATLRNSNIFSKYLTVLLPVSMSLFLCFRRFRYKLVLAGITVLGVMALVMTLTRSGWIGFAVSLMVVFILFMTHRGLRPSAAPQILILGILLMGLLATQANMLVTRFTADDHGSAYSRIPLMQVAWNMIVQNPLLGVGTNNYTTVMFSYDNTNEQVLSHFPMPVHNVFLLYAAEIGLLGLMAYLAVLFQALRNGVLVSRASNRFQASIAIGMTAGIIALLVQDLVDWSTKYDYALITLLWVFFACLSAMRHPLFRMEDGSDH